MCLVFHTHVSEGFSLCLCVFIRAEVQLVCFTVCVQQKEFMLFGVNTAHNGALNSEPLQAWANGVLRLPHMITPLCPQGQTTPFGWEERMRLIQTHPKIIKSVHFVLFSLWHWASLLKFSTEGSKEKVSSVNLQKDERFLLGSAGYVSASVTEEARLPSESAVKC